MRWETDDGVKSFEANTKIPFRYWLYSVNSFKAYQPPRHKVLSKALRLIDQLLFMFDFA